MNENQVNLLEGERNSSPNDLVSQSINNTTKDTTEPEHLGAAPCSASYFITAGGGTDATGWAINEKGVSEVGLDIRGYGNSKVRFPTRTLEDVYNTIKHLYQEVNKKSVPVGNK